MIEVYTNLYVGNEQDYQDHKNDPDFFFVQCACNQGQSRGPGVAMLALRNLLPDDYNEAKKAFKKVYPPYDPRPGIEGFIKSVWGGTQ